MMTNEYFGGWKFAASACNGYQNDRVMIAAASDAFWAGGSACGRNYKVECRGATNQGDPNPCRGQDYMVVKIVYYCPSGCQGTIDLSQEAFAAIANPDADKTEISFHQYVDHLLMLLSAVALVSNCML
ncbi:hypothetical protein ERO13_A13G029150v2 [Gossypium hirsutum]|uniref:Expansin-like EG45 domain-containing protein n=1 Tax=Gossypium tomentosum TaxID=34277 RepID=A0A5D2MFM4_GOSTO|nr:hypothetical protein ERO13_A13G029150v2 [Gossypium hirsutum]TYH90173.1 hypothetical protein ES332_A13G032000v1 [Gossypium tomentosum]